MHLVQYVAIAPPLLRGAPALLVVQNALIHCAVDRTQIDQRMLEILAALGTTIMATLTLRNVPTAVPWGTLTLPREEADTAGLLVPKITPGGISIPLPHHLITEDLAQNLAVLGGSVLRFYHPPTS